MKLYVYHTPERTPDGLPDCAIAIDVLRATTTIATALHAGAEAVATFSDLDALRQAGAAWPPERRLLLGERGGQTVEGFDLGNSPLDCVPDVVGGKRLFLSTTNGTRALQRIANAPAVLTAAQVNRGAAVSYLRERQPEIVWLVGSGWQGDYSLEDTACAGAIAAAFGTDLAGNDETIGAIALYAQWEACLLELLRASTHGQRLQRLGNEADLAYCAQTDTLDVLPMQSEAGVLVAQSAAVATGS